MSLKTVADHLQVLERVVTTTRYHSLGEAQEALDALQAVRLEIAGLRQQLVAACDRIAGQSELLSKRAEKICPSTQE